MNELLLKLKSYIDPVLSNANKSLLNTEITDRTLDDKVLDILTNKKIVSDDVEINFSEPKDTIYNSSAGRTPYDLLIYGKIDMIPFKIFLNNKWGNIKGSTKNDTTSYNNLLRLYFDVTTQRIKKDDEIDERPICDRCNKKEIRSYAIFVIDKITRDYRFFFFEELKGDFYVNPRNNYFQVKYDPELLNIPRTYPEFCNSLLEAIIISRKKLLKSTNEEMLAVSKLTEIINNNSNTND